MTKRQIPTMTARIERDDPSCHVTGVRSYGKGYYALDVVDVRTGYPFVVNDAADWQSRMARESDPAWDMPPA